MKHREMAVTLVKYYLASSPWIVRSMAVVRDKNRQLVWRVVKRYINGDDYSPMLQAAYALSRKMEIPFIMSLKRGQSVSATDKLMLAQCGIACPKK